MAGEVNRRFLLKRRPSGRFERDDFDRVEEDVPEPGEGQALVRNLYLSLDPTNRIWASEVDGYMPPVPLGEVMRGVGLGEVVSSRADEYPEGSLLTGFTGWQDYLVADPRAEYPLSALPAKLPAPPSTMLGAMGSSGLTAYFGLTDIGKPQEGETVVISAAAGSVGSVAGQIVKALGARAVGLAGSDEKCDWLRDELGFDAAVNYKDDDWREQLAAACPDGVDVDFENVGGEIMDHVLSMLNLNARVILCGLISQYNEVEASWKGPANFEQFLMKRATLKGFIVLDHFDRAGEAMEALGGWMAEGKVLTRETIVEGLDEAPEAINQLFEGKNFGKLLVKIADPSGG